MQGAHCEHKNSFQISTKLPSDWRANPGAGTIAFIGSGWLFSQWYFFMSSSPVGLALRLIGPLIEGLCLILLQKWGGQERTIAGLPIEYPLYAGLAVGFILVVLGLTWFRSRPAGSSDRP